MVNQRWVAKKRFMQFESVNGIKPNYEDHGKGAEKGAGFMGFYVNGCFRPASVQEMSVLMDYFGIE